MYNKNKYLISILLLFGIAGCKQVPMLPGLSAHKIDIQQGNAVTQEMVSKLQPGMTRNQVRFVLGTPLLVDPFRSDRWDYFYSYVKSGQMVEQRKLAVFFKDDKLVRVEGDVIPAKPVAEKPAADTAKPAAATTKPDAAKPAEAKPEVAKVVPTKPAPVEAPAAPATLVTGDGAPVGSGVSATPDKPAEKTAVAKPEVKAEEKPKEERGFFGRMLDKIGL